MPGPIASKKLILSSSVGTATAKLALGDGGVGHGGVDHAGQEAALADRPCEWQKAGTTSKRKRAIAARRNRSRAARRSGFCTASMRLALRAASDLGVAAARSMWNAGKIGMGRIHARADYSDRAPLCTFSEQFDQGADFGRPKGCDAMRFSWALAPAARSAPAPSRPPASGQAHGCGRRSASDGASGGRAPAGGRGSAPGSSGRCRAPAPAPSGSVPHCGRPAPAGRTRPASAPRPPWRRSLAKSSNTADWARRST